MRLRVLAFTCIELYGMRDVKVGRGVFPTDL